MPEKPAEPRDPAERAVLVALGNEVKVRRDLLGLTQQQLADRVGMSNSNIGHIEGGSRNLSLLNLMRLAFGLECSAADLVRNLPLPPIRPFEPRRRKEQG